MPVRVRVCIGDELDPSWTGARISLLDRLIVRMDLRTPRYRLAWRLLPVINIAGMEAACTARMQVCAVNLTVHLGHPWLVILIAASRGAPVSGSAGITADDNGKRCRSDRTGRCDTGPSSPARAGPA